MEFKQQVLGQPWPKDPEYDLYLRAWFAYHKCCDTFENHMFPPNGMPKTAKDYRAMHQNVHVAHAIRNDVIERHLERRFRVSELDQDKWHRAKLEAVRLVEAGYEKIP